jgi:hypothetical protein
VTEPAKLSRLDKFSLITGIIGLAADTLAIGSFAASLGLLSLPSQSSTVSSTAGNLLITAVVGFYSLTLIVWFLIRLERSRKHGEIGDLGQRILDLDEENAPVLALLLVPLLGPIFLCIARPTRIIFLLTVFIAFFPTTLWIYTLSASAWQACGFGFLGSMTISQFSTFFALVLDKFFH